MSSPTAGAAASIRIGSATYSDAPAHEPVVYGPKLILPRWVDSTVQVIRNSVIPVERVHENDGRWITQAIADAATDFFQETADLLPGEPIVYSSQQGDLVAEFACRRGTLTSIISLTFVLLFAVIDGKPIERRVVNGVEARRELKNLTAALRGV